MSRVCESCGAKLDQKAKFCPMCGTTAPEEPVSPESEPHEPFHLDPAVAAKTAASVSARAFGYAVSAIFIIMVVCTIYALSVTATLSFGGDLFVGLAAGTIICALVGGIIYGMARRAGMFSERSELPPPVPATAVRPGGPSAPGASGAGAEPPHPSVVREVAMAPFKALLMALAAFMAIVVVITTYAAIVSAMLIIKAPLWFGILVATVVWGTVGWFIYKSMFGRKENQ